MDTLRVLYNLMDYDLILSGNIQTIVVSVMYANGKHVNTGIGQTLVGALADLLDQLPKDMKAHILDECDDSCTKCSDVCPVEG